MEPIWTKLPNKGKEQSRHSSKYDKYELIIDIRAFKFYNEYA